MTDALNAVEKAAFDLLSTGVSGAAVYQHAPANATPPVVIVADMQSAQLAVKDGPDRRVGLSIVVITEGQERKPCSSLCSQVEALLHDASASVAGFNVSFSYQDTSIVLADANTYLGTVGFVVWALAE